MNANLENLAKMHGDRAEDVHKQIRDLGGFGDVPADYIGGLDIFGVLSPENTAITEKAKNKIAELAGVNRKDADKMVETGKVITKAGSETVANR